MVTFNEAIINKLPQPRNDAYVIKLLGKVSFFNNEGQAKAIVEASS